MGEEKEGGGGKALAAGRTAWPEKVKKAVVYIEESFTQNIHLDNLAELLGMDKSSFCRLFKKETGVTFTEYLNRLRLEEARRLLLSSHFYVFEVAHRSGFSRTRYFQRLFRERYGCSPSEYRDRFQPSQR